MEYLSKLLNNSKKKAYSEYYVRTFSGNKYWGRNIVFHSQGKESFGSYTMEELDEIKNQIISSAQQQGYTDVSDESILFLINSTSASASLFFGVRL